uniref:Uncharacterized protein n=2 Tax=Kalmanozyma brasiliensis (strain GHG001) TaxID=1365824 RepID=V5E9X6_KALBG
MPDAIFKLYPSDGDDLDTYLSGRHQWEWAGLDDDHTEEDRKWHKKLLEDLVDFNSAVQRYVMATHGVDCDRMVRSGVKIRKLVVDLTKDRGPDLEDSLMRSLASLEQAANAFRGKFHDLERKCIKNRVLEVDLVRKQEAARTEQERLDTSAREARAKKFEIDRKMRAANERMDAAVALERKLEDKGNELAAQQRSLFQQGQELLGQKRNMELQTSLKITNMQSQNNSALTAMRREVDAATKKAADAEEARKAAHSKSCHLAEQMEKMKQLLKSRKKDAGPSLRTASTEELEAKERRIRALELQIKSKDDLLKKAGLSATPQRRAAGSSSRLSSATFVDLTRSSSPFDQDTDSFPTTPLDGVNLASRASTPAYGVPESSPTIQRKDKGKKRVRVSLSVEPERLDDTSDDEYFPMPGLVMPKKVRQDTSKANSPHDQPEARRGRDEAKTPEPTSKPSSTFASTKSPLVPRVAPQASASTSDITVNIAAKSPSHKDGKPGKKRKRTPTPSTTSVIDMDMAAGSSSIDMIARETSAGAMLPFLASASGSKQKTMKDKKHLTNYDWIKDPKGKKYGPKHRPKAS